MSETRTQPTQAVDGHYHDSAGKYDYCADPTCPRVTFSVTVTFKMTTEQRDAYAREYSLGHGDSPDTWQADPSLVSADIREHAAEHVTAAIGQDYMLHEFTSHKVSTPR